MRAPMRPLPATANPSREWGSPEGANRRFGPFGATLLVLFCSRQKSTVKTRPADVRRVHFSTVGGLHGVRLPRLKNFFKTAFRRRSASTLLHRRRPSRRAPAKAKELIFQKPLSADARRVHFSTVGGLHGVRLPRLKLTFLHTGICNTPHPGQRACQG